MFAASLVGMKGWFSTRCALTWRVKDTKSSRSYFLLQASTRRTAATESGLLLTPTTREDPVDLDKFKARMEKYPNGTTMPNLATQVQQMLPTPQANCSKGMSPQNVELRGNKLYNKKTGQQIQSSPEQWAKMGMLPTPNTMDHIQREGMRPSRAATNRKTGYLSEMAQLLPTPMAQEGSKISGKANQDSLTKRARQQTGKTSQLSPLFVEEMMGFPKGWTASPFQSGEENP
jgi:hypothetical protein